MNVMLQKMQELLVHHYNVSSAMGREGAARGMGLNPEPYKHPYPGSTNNYFTMTVPTESKLETKITTTETVPVNSPPTQNKSWWDYLWPVLLALGFGVLSGIFVWFFSPKVVLPNPTPQPSNITNVDNVELEVRWRLEDGKWIKEVERVKKP